MDRFKPVKRRSIIVAVLTILSFILVMIFAPKLEDPRIIYGVRFSTKTGAPGLTNLGLILLAGVPLVTFILSSLILKLLKIGNDDV